jgi:hypothetical protein
MNLSGPEKFRPASLKNSVIEQGNNLEACNPNPKKN